MTGNNTKLRAVTLAALMVLSVMVGSIAFTGAAAATNHTADADVVFDDPPNDNGTLVWAGQEIAVDHTYNSGDAVQLRRVTDSGSSLVKQYSADSNGVVNISTAGRAADQYIIRGPSGDDFTFELAEQNLDASFDPATTTQGKSSTVALDSNRGSGKYNVIVSSDDLDVDQLQTLFGGTQVDTGDSDTDVDSVEFAHTDTRNVNVPSDFAAGNYSIDFAVNDSDASSSANLVINKKSAGSAGFPSSIVREQRGDVAAITVSLQDATSADVSVGSESINYHTTMTVNDVDEDGEVTILFNTYLAGQHASDEGVAYSAAGDDTVDTVNRTTGQFTNRRLAAGDYELTASINDRETGVATLVVEERATTGARTWIAPKNAQITEAGDVSDVVTERSNVANEDQVILQFDATGIYGYVDSDHSFNGSEDGVGLTITQTKGSTAPNQDPKSLNVSNTTKYFDADNDTFYVVVPTEEFDVSKSEAYRGTLTLNSSSPYVDADETESVETLFTVEERQASFNGLNSDGDLVVNPESGHAISGSTNIAPGTELSFRARSTSTDNPFLKTGSAEVQADGSVSTTMDFSDVPADTEFTASIREGGDALTSVNAIVQEETTTTTTTTTAEETTTTTAEETTTTTAEETTTTTTEEPTTTTTTEEETPGFGVVVGLIAILGAALLALRREN